jgi:hypothetical protein
MSYLTQLQANNTSLQACIDKANALPEAGGGGESSDSFTNVTVNFSWSTTSSSYAPEVFYSMAHSSSGDLVGNTYRGSGTSGTTTLTIAKNSMICVIARDSSEFVGVGSYTASSGISHLNNYSYSGLFRYDNALFFIRDNGNLTITTKYSSVSGGGSN